jgi:hypothetical protein
MWGCARISCKSRWLADSMRLSLMKAAHEDVGGAPWQEIRVAHRFRPTYA